MSASVGIFKELVARAQRGDLKLPAFQRNWRWRDEKVLKLYDSLRLRYPIGAFLFLPGKDDFLSPRPFSGARPDAEGFETEYLVLDGQQRLTAGIHLFYATGKKQYYIDLKRLSAMAAETSLDFEDQDAVKAFCSNIDYEDSYLVSRAAVIDPRALLITQDILCTSILTDSAKFNMAALDYVKEKPEKAALIYQVVQPHFALSDTDAVPYILIDEKPSISAISRIFTTLNTTGQMLTPFELVVATLYPIKLQQEVADYRDAGQWYGNMDATGEVLLQTIAMLASVDQKKSNLPKTINATIYTQHKQAAFEALEALGHFLTSALGCGLDATGRLVPYDAIFAPMACGLRYITAKGMTGAEEAAAKKKLRLWFVASALTQRYQEGVHNKQSRDYKEFLQWVDDETRKPAWIEEARVPFFTNKSFEGAIGKLVQCLINSRDPRDPVVIEKRVGFRAGAEITEKHHIFPSKYVANLAGWTKDEDDANTLLNIMYVERGTNKRWLNANPREHLAEARKSVSTGALIQYYDRQFIPAEAVAILEKTDKAKSDFYKFLELRQASIRAWINQEFGIQSVDAQLEPDEELEASAGNGELH